MNCNIEVKLLNGLTDEQFDRLVDYPDIYTCMFSAGTLTFTVSLLGSAKAEQVFSILYDIDLCENIDYDTDKVLIYRTPEVEIEPVRDDYDVEQLGRHIRALSGLVIHGDRVAISEIETLIGNYMNPDAPSYDYEF